MNRLWLLLAGMLAGAIVVALAPVSTLSLRSYAAAVPGLAWLAPPTGTPVAPPSHEDHEDRDAIKLSDRQVEAARIEIVAAGAGALERRLRVPGAIIPNGDRIARVAVKLVGTVAELRKRPGDVVDQNEVVAVIESREVADAKSEYLATRLTNDLQQTLFARASMLWEKRISSENDFLRARAIADDARNKIEIARQKLSALGLTEAQIASLPNDPVETLRQHELRSPMSGRVAERRVDLGALVGREGQESELFVIVDLTEVWVELAVASADLVSVQEGQEISISAGAGQKQAEAKIIFIGLFLDKDTRSARVVASLDNSSFKWRPGVFVTGEILLEKRPVDILVPKNALQNIKGEATLFVRTEEGFERRKVTTGGADDRNVEIRSGLSAGERIAVSNTFVLKAELEKGSAEHDD